MVDKFGNVLNAGDTVLFIPELTEPKLIGFEGVLQDMHGGLYLRYPYAKRFCLTFLDDGFPCYELTKIQ